MEIVADGDPGGGTTHVLQLLKGLDSACSLGLVTQKDSYLWGEARALGIPLFGADFFRSRLDASVPLKLRHFVRSFGPQVVHAHGGRAGFFHALAARRVPMVYTVHGYHFLHKRPLVRQLASYAERLATTSAARVIFVSKHDAEVARAYNLLPCLERGLVIYNGIRPAGIPRAEQKSFHLGFVGRLEYPKDPLLFLEVVERLPGYVSTIVGDGALGSEVSTEICRRGLSNRVRMLGALPHLETLRELSKFGTLVMTSRWEGLPVLPLEAMCAGVPVVATNVGGLGEIIESGTSGQLVEGRSADGLARAVARLEEDAALRGRIIKEGRNRVQKLFSEERMLREILTVYEQVAAL